MRHPVTYSGSPESIDTGLTLPPPSLGSHTTALRDWLTGPADNPLPELKEEDR